MISPHGTLHRVVVSLSCLFFRGSFHPSMPSSLEVLFPNSRNSSSPLNFPLPLLLVARCSKRGSKIAPPHGRSITALLFLCFTLFTFPFYDMTVWICFICVERVHPVTRPLKRIICGHAVCAACIDLLVKFKQSCPLRCPLKGDKKALTPGDARTLDISVVETEADEDDLAALQCVHHLYLSSLPD